MRDPWPAEVEAGRITTGRMGSNYGDRDGGAFTFLHGANTLTVIASTGADWVEAGLAGPPWEHVSISLRHRCPTWDEMVYVAGLFWEPSEVLIQFRPRAEDYRNHHPYGLHWWRPIGVVIPTPPASTVAPAPRSSTGANHAG